MKYIFYTLLILSLISCQDDESGFNNSQWVGANGIIKPDTVAKTLIFNPDNYDAIIRTSVAYPSYPNEDTTLSRVVVAGYFKNGNSFSKIDGFEVNGTSLPYYKESFYPSYFYNPNQQFSFYSNFDLKMMFDDQEYNYSYQVEDILGNIQISSSVLDGDITFDFEKKWDVYSLHAYFAFFNPIGDELYYSMNKTYEILSPDDFVISKSEIENIAKNTLGINLEHLTKVSFSIIASDTSEVMIGNKRTLLYNSAEKIYTFNYVMF